MSQPSVKDMLKDFDLTQSLTEIKKREEEIKAQFGPLPEGFYLSILDNVEVKPSGKGNPYLKLTFKLLGEEGGKVRNRQIFENLNVAHPNEVVVGIANQKLASVLSILGIAKDDLQNPEKFQSKKIILKLKQKESTYQGNTRVDNVISYMKREGDLKDSEQLILKLDSSTGVESSTPF